MCEAKGMAIIGRPLAPNLVKRIRHAILSRVLEIAEGELPDTNIEVVWDGTSSRGHRVTNSVGVAVYVVTTVQVMTRENFNEWLEKEVQR